MSLSTLQRSRSRHISRACFETLEARQLLSFSPATSFPVGTNPQAVATADFNNDGRLDLATANSGSDSVSVLLGNADGSFLPAQTSATGPYPVSLAAGDFNADGNLDVATANQDIFTDTGDNDVSILLGKGDGTFAAAGALSISQVWAYSWSIATGDLNADGKLDLVVTSEDDASGGYVDVLLGHGDGMFAAAAPYGPYVGQIFSPALADVNGDGKVDVAVTSWQTGSVKVFLGSGNGTLQAPRDFATDRGSNSVAAGDFNADAKLDLVTANYSDSSNSVSMLLGNGDGTFQTARFFAAGNHPQSATASDVNGDGKLDVVVTNALSPGAVSVLIGNGDGSLAAPITTATGSSPTTLVTADFNGDGRPDAATNAGSNNVAVLLNDGAWPDQTTPRLQIGDRSVTEGNTGTASATFTVTLSAPSTQTVTVAYATGNGTATPGSDYQAASGTLSFAPGQVSKTITVPVYGDRLGEPNETFNVNVSGATNASIGDGQAIGTILDNEPRISIDDVTRTEGRRGTTYFTFTVTLSAAYDQTVTTSFRTYDGTATTSNGDYTAKSGTLSFAPGERTKTITVAVRGDSKREANETFTVQLFAATSNALLLDALGVGTILNDD